MASCLLPESEPAHRGHPGQAFRLTFIAASRPVADNRGDRPNVSGHHAH